MKARLKPVVAEYLPACMANIFYKLKRFGLISFKGNRWGKNRTLQELN